MNPEESMRTKRSAATRDDAIGTSTYIKVASIVASIGGWAVGMYSGVSLLVPLIATAVVWLVGRNVFSESKQIALPAFCVQAGHLIWFVVGVVMSRQLASPALIDIVWLAIGLAWLGLRPGKVALYVLIIYQLLALPYNVLQFSQTDFGTTANKALLVHVIWHCIALFYMARMFYRLGKPVQEK
jgi:hypothetical protein